MGEARTLERLSDAAGGRPAGRLVARPGLSGFWRDQRGATAIEYALLISILGLGIATAGGLLGQQIYAKILQIVAAVNTSS